ncbi:MAG: YegS/Rv2252/BmrU family lipid kinase [Bacteroidia bacterium]
MRHIGIICNSKSGKGRSFRLLSLLEELLKKDELMYTIHRDNLPKLLDDYTDLVILGGDGTLNFVLNRFKEIEIPIGIIPCGTGNDIGYTLLGKRTMEEYLIKSLYGVPQPVDAGLCNGRFFLNGVGIGFDGWIVRKLWTKKWFNGKAAYYYTVLSLLLFYRETRVRLQIDESLSELKLFMFCAANGISYGGGFQLAPKASMNDQLLDMLTVSKISLWNRLRYLPVIEKGKHLNKPIDFIRYQQAKRVIVISDQLLQAHLDGEWIEDKHFEIHVLPSYLKIRC